MGILYPYLTTLSHFTVYKYYQTYLCLGKKIIIPIPLILSPISNVARNAWSGFNYRYVTSDNVIKLKGKVACQN